MMSYNVGVSNTRAIFVKSHVLAALELSAAGLAARVNARPSYSGGRRLVHVI